MYGKWQIPVDRKKYARMFTPAHFSVRKVQTFNTVLEKIFFVRRTSKVSLFGVALRAES